MAAKVIFGLRTLSETGTTVYVGRNHMSAKGFSAKSQGQNQAKGLRGEEKGRIYCTHTQNTPLYTDVKYSQARGEKCLADKKEGGVAQTLNFSIYF